MAFAQTSAPDLSLRGTVSDSLTHRPLAHVLVHSGDSRLATLTDNEGHFTFDLKPAAAYSVPLALPMQREVDLQAIKPGYFPAWQQVTLSSSSAEAPAIDLVLTPLSTIRGHISAPDWDHPEHIPVMLLLRQRNNGRFMWNQVNGTATNSRGDFAFSGLVAGDYAVFTTQWREAAYFTSSTRVPVEGFPPLYTGDSTDLETAPLLHLRIGDTQAVELHLHKAPFYPVTIPVAPSNGNLQINFVGAQAFSGYGLQYNPTHGALEGALPTGHYRILGQANDADGRTTFAQMDLHVQDAPLRTSPLTLTPAASIPVRIGGTSSADGFSLDLELSPETLGVPGRQANIGPQSAREIPGVPPGRYWVQVRSSNPGYVTSLTSSGVDLAQQVLSVGAGGAVPTIDVTLGSGTGTLTGTLQSLTGTPIPPNALVQLLPDSGNLNESVFSQTAGPDGIVRFKDLVPGTYRALALPAGDTAALVTLMQQPLPSALPAVTIHAGEPTTAAIPFFQVIPTPDDRP